MEEAQRESSAARKNRDKAMKQPFEQVVAQHGPAVYRVCRAILSPHDAEDAWSETFLAALKAYPRLDAGANVEAWLVTIAHRKAIDVTRVHGRTAITVETMPERASILGIPDDVGSELWEAVGLLPAKQRQAIAYHYLGGLPHKEVAAILGGTPEAARRASADGIAALRKSYLPIGEIR